MPAIKPRTTRKHFVRHITRLYRENNETLFAYAAFIGESTEYVLNQLVETVLAKDRDFQTWRAIIRARMCRRLAAGGTAARGSHPVARRRRAIGR